MISSEELRKLLDEGRVSIGCPLPEGFTGMTEHDKAQIEIAMHRIIDMEKKKPTG